jgi:hypothetical protein
MRYNNSWKKQQVNKYGNGVFKVICFGNGKI